MSEIKPRACKKCGGEGHVCMDKINPPFTYRPHCQKCDFEVEGLYEDYEAGVWAWNLVNKNEI